MFGRQLWGTAQSRAEHTHTPAVYTHKDVCMGLLEGPSRLADRHMGVYGYQDKNIYWVGI